MRCQLTVIGTFAQAIIATKVKDNRFTIKTNGPNVEVSWQVTGIRRDPYAEKHRIPVEEAKSEEERGYFLHPEAYGHTEEKSIEWAREPELLRQIRIEMKDRGVPTKSLPPPGSGALIALKDQSSSSDYEHLLIGSGSIALIVPDLCSQSRDDHQRAGHKNFGG